VIGQAIDLVRVRAEQQGVDIDLCGPDRALEAEADRSQLCSVLVNLFFNALDAMPQGGRLEVELIVEPAGIRIAVADTGGGIAGERMEDLFTPFASSKPAGTGLGLSISRRIIEEHGGSLHAANRSPHGARFLISLPAPALASTVEEANGSCAEKNHADTANRR
jgi:signal transduction histidine kinase